MLEAQSDRTVTGVRALVDWLEVTPLTNPLDLERIENEVDGMRHAMEEKLVNSFSTPFDRQDIYSISRQMDYILNFSKETAKEMYAFGVQPDAHIRAMAGELLMGTECLARGIHALDSDKGAVEEEIRHARASYNALEERYIAGHGRTLENQRCHVCNPDPGDLPSPARCRPGNARYARYPAQCGHRLRDVKKKIDGEL